MKISQGPISVKSSVWVNTMLKSLDETGLAIGRRPFIINRGRDSSTLLDGKQGLCPRVPYSVIPFSHRLHIVIDTVARAVIASSGGISDGDQVEDRLWAILPQEGVTNSFC